MTKLPVLQQVLEVNTPMRAAIDPATDSYISIYSLCVPAIQQGLRAVTLEYRHYVGAVRLALLRHHRGGHVDQKAALAKRTHAHDLLGLLFLLHQHELLRMELGAKSKGLKAKNHIAALLEHPVLGMFIVLGPEQDQADRRDPWREAHGKHT
jgi:hypothetical protein